MDRPFRVELGALEEIQGVPRPNACSKGRQRPVPGEAFSCEGLRDGAPSSCLGPTVQWGGAAAPTLQTLRATSEAAKRVTLTLVWIRALQRCRWKPNSSGSWRPGSPRVRPGLPERL